MKNIHDKAFAQLLGERSFFLSFAKAYLPKNIQKLIDWNSIVLHKMDGRHINEKNQKLSIADVIYFAKIKKHPGMLWVHLEHQSTPDPFMLLRSIHYQTGELLNYINVNKTKKAPPIITMIYYQGKKQYPYSLDLKDIFTDLALGLKNFGKPILIDLPNISDGVLRQHEDIGPIEILLKHIRQKGFSKKYRAVIARLQEVSDDKIRKIALRYLIERADVNIDTLLETITEYLPKDKEATMTGAEQLIQRGELRGMQQGMQLRNFEVAKNMLDSGCDPEFISRMTSLSDQEIQKLRDSEKEI